MSWIRELEPRDDPAVKAMHETWHAKRGFVPNIIRVFSLKPALMRAFDDFSRVVTFGGTGLRVFKQRALDRPRARRLSPAARAAVARETAAPAPAV